MGLKGGVSCAKICLRLAIACLLVFLTASGLARAGGPTGESAYDIGEKLFARKQYKTALKYYRKALERNDERGAYRMGLVFEHAGNDLDALDAYRRFIDSGQPGVDRSDAAQRVNAIEGRLKQIEERQKKHAARTNELLERGKRLLKKGRYRDAEKVLLQAISGDRANPEVHFHLGDAYLGLESYAKATAEYKKAKKLSQK